MEFTFDMMACEMIKWLFFLSIGKSREFHVMCSSYTVWSNRGNSGDVPSNHAGLLLVSFQLVMSLHFYFVIK